MCTHTLISWNTKIPHSEAMMEGPVVMMGNAMAGDRT